MIEHDWEKIGCVVSWRKIPKIGGVWTLRTLAFWMYDSVLPSKL